ncbi:MAG: translation initiation factor IF-2 subunit beta [Candidatus Bathyarchaeota archaeon]|nr:translation initiation factor IF-2 subunit beta [Candidatus Bathyarchaeota archaeon]
MKYDYKELLKRARSQLPSDVFERKRFEIPKPRSITVGMRTIILNFKEICDAFNRDPQHLLRYLSREMATAGTVSGARAVFQGRFPRDTIERLVQHYGVAFVVCPVCKRPDTKIVREKRLSFMVCEACGARSSVRSM